MYMNIKAWKHDLRYIYVTIIYSVNVPLNEKYELHTLMTTRVHPCALHAAMGQWSSARNWWVLNSLSTVTSALFKI